MKNKSTRVSRKGKKLTIELDIAGDCDLTIRKITSTVKKEAKPFNVECELLKEVGPAGGNPLYAMTGTEDELRKYLKEHYCKNNGLKGKDLDDEVEFLLGNE